jgi:hypothetical protein
MRSANIEGAVPPFALAIPHPLVRVVVVAGGAASSSSAGGGVVVGTGPGGAGVSGEGDDVTTLIAPRPRVAATKAGASFGASTSIAASAGAISASSASLLTMRTIPRDQLFFAFAAFGERAPFVAMTSSIVTTRRLAPVTVSGSLPNHGNEALPSFW